jgi:hypothetical protein
MSWLDRKYLVVVGFVMLAILNLCEVTDSEKELVIVLAVICFIANNCVERIEFAIKSLKERNKSND